jgi:hypothetical protein
VYCWEWDKGQCFRDCSEIFHTQRHTSGINFRKTVTDL